MNFPVVRVFLFLLVVINALKRYSPKGNNYSQTTSSLFILMKTRMKLRKGLYSLGTVCSFWSLKECINLFYLESPHPTLSDGSCVGLKHPERIFFKLTIIQSSNPCIHDGPCSKQTNCPCWTNGLYCQRECSCPKTCTSRRHFLNSLSSNFSSRLTEVERLQMQIIWEGWNALRLWWPLAMPLFEGI